MQMAAHLAQRTTEVHTLKPAMGPKSAMWLAEVFSLCALQVVHNFDVDASAMLYDSTDVWAADRALRALHHGFLLIDPWRQSPSYTYRLVKYCARYGLAIIDPAMDERLTAHSDSYMPAMKATLKSQGKSGISEWQGLAQLLLLCSNQHQGDPLGLNDTKEHSFYEHAGIPETVQFCMLWSHKPEIWRAKLREQHLKNVDMIDFADANYKLHLAAALSRRKQIMVNAGSQPLQVVFGSDKHQPHADWYAHVQQLVQGSKA